MPYHNNFGSVWEYQSAFTDKAIDFTSYLGPVCPICAGRGCYREITPYSRRVCELLPHREELVLIARFQCTTRLTTFSLLPVQLAPYRRYTIVSMVYALLLAQDIGEDEGFGPSAVAEKLLPRECRVTGFLIGCWLMVFLQGLRGAHHNLTGRYRLAGICTRTERRGRLNEVLEYFVAFAAPRAGLAAPCTHGVRGTPGGAANTAARGPPGTRRSVHSLVNQYSRATGRFLFGTPSQNRRGRSAR